MNQQDNVSNMNAFGIKSLLPVVFVSYGWFEYYKWSHLVWFYGSERPDFPHCDEVDIERAWV
jgi:hypothetical protein